MSLGIIRNRYSWLTTCHQYDSWTGRLSWHLGGSQNASWRSSPNFYSRDSKLFEASQGKKWRWSVGTGSLSGLAPNRKADRSLRLWYVLAFFSICFVSRFPKQWLCPVVVRKSLRYNPAIELRSVYARTARCFGANIQQSARDLWKVESNEWYRQASWDLFLFICVGWWSSADWAAIVPSYLCM